MYLLIAMYDTMLCCTVSISTQNYQCCTVSISTQAIGYFSLLLETFWPDLFQKKIISFLSHIII